MNNKVNLIAVGCGSEYTTENFDKLCNTIESLNPGDLVMIVITNCESTREPSVAKRYYIKLISKYGDKLIRFRDDSSNHTRYIVGLDNL